MPALKKIAALTEVATSTPLCFCTASREGEHTYAGETRIV